ncbi:MAG: hypothetical protein C4329_10020 [Chitinophagaceae bacterium]
MNAKTLPLRVLKENKRMQQMKIVQKSGPRIRRFLYLDEKNNERAMKTITLYSPSPLAEQ